MKKTILCLLSLALLMLPVLPVLAAEETPAVPISLWSGDEDTSWFTEDFAGYDAATKTYTLTTADQFAGLGSVATAQNDYLKGYTIRLASNLVFNEGDASAWGLFNQPENIWAPIPNFKGTLDGAGYAISGIFASGANKVALFACVDGATIRNLAIVNSYFLATDAPVAAFVGEVNDHPAVFESLYTDASVNGAYNGGGIVGRFMENCAVMKAEATVFDSCVFAGKIDVTHWPAGGLLGNSNLSRATVKNCINAGTIKAGEQYAGGFIGLAKMNVYVFENCLSLGRVEKCPASGAFLGDANQTDITMRGCCYLKGAAPDSDHPFGQPVNAVINGSEKTATDGACFAQVLAALGDNLKPLTAYIGEQIIDGWIAVPGSYPVPNGALSAMLAAVRTNYPSFIKLPEPPTPGTDDSGKDTDTEQPGGDGKTTSGEAKSDEPQSGSEAQTTGADGKSGEKGCQSAVPALTLLPVLLGAAWLPVFRRKQ